MRAERHEAFALAEDRAGRSPSTSSSTTTCGPRAWPASWCGRSTTSARSTASTIADRITLVVEADDALAAVVDGPPRLDHGRGARHRPHRRPGRRRRRPDHRRRPPGPSACSLQRGDLTRSGAGSRPDQRLSARIGRPARSRTQNGLERSAAENCRTPSGWMLGMEPCIERSIVERASDQLGHINRPQLRSLSIGPRARTPPRRRWLARPCRGPDLPHGRRRTRTFEGIVMAACLDLDAVASHRTAAAPARPRHHAVGPRPHRGVRAQGPPAHPFGARPRPHVDEPRARTTSAGYGGSRRRPSPARSSAWPPSYPRSHWTTSATSSTSPSDDRRASDGWLTWRLEQLRCRGRNGVSVLEGILAEREGKGRTESWLERAFLGSARTRPGTRSRRSSNASVAQGPSDRPRRLPLRAEAGHRGQRATASHSTRRQLEADAARRNRLKLAGFDDHRVHLRPRHTGSARYVLGHRGRARRASRSRC